jgi:hypothetical protein
MREVVHRGRAAAARGHASAATHQQKRSTSPAFVCMAAMAAVLVALHDRSLRAERHKAAQLCPSLRVRPWWRRVNRVQKKPQMIDRMTWLLRSGEGESDGHVLAILPR